MKFSQARQGRIFVIRLEDGEIVHEVIERFAAEQSIRAAAIIAVGALDSGSRVVVGPEEGRSTPWFPWSICWKMSMRWREPARSFPMKKAARRSTCTVPWAGKTGPSPGASGEGSRCGRFWKWFFGSCWARRRAGRPIPRWVSICCSRNDVFMSADTASRNKEKNEREI